MVARAAFGRALIASGGTFLALGGATFVVSSLSMGVARTVLDQRKKKLAVTCRVCQGHKKVQCDVCGGGKVVRYHPFKEAPLGPRTPHTACAMCGAEGQQTCTNCLGEGSLLPFVGPGAHLVEAHTLTCDMPPPSSSSSSSGPPGAAAPAAGV